MEKKKVGENAVMWSVVVITGADKEVNVTLSASLVCIFHNLIKLQRINNANNGKVDLTANNNNGNDNSKCASTMKNLHESISPRTSMSSENRVRFDFSLPVLWSLSSMSFSVKETEINCEKMLILKWNINKGNDQRAGWLKLVNLVN